MLKPEETGSDGFNTSMIWRLSATGFALWGGYDAVRMLDCGSVTLEWPDVWVCHTSVESGVAPGLYAGVACLVILFLLLILFWVPWVVRRKRASRMDTASTLMANLTRVINLESSPTSGTSPDPEPSRSQGAVRLRRSASYGRGPNVSPRAPFRSLTHTEPDDGTAPDPILTSTATLVREDQLYRRVAEMRRVVSSGSVSPQATAQWLQLLKEINDLHNAGELSTAMFRQMNTKLLSVIEGPPAE